MDNFITPEEAREMPLSLNPIKRSRQVSEVISSLGFRAVGFNAGFAFHGRGTLVRLAESHEESVAIVEGIRAREITE